MLNIYFSIVSATEFNQFGIVLRFDFIVEPSVMLLNSMTPIFFKMVTHEIFFCIRAYKGQQPRQYGGRFFVLIAIVATLVLHVFAS